MNEHPDGATPTSGSKESDACRDLLERIEREDQRRGDTVSTDDSEPDSRVGTMIGSLRLERRVGAGNMGVVYQAHHVGLGLERAVKFLRPDRTDMRAEIEARALALTQHDHALTVFDAGMEGDTPFLVTEWVDGIDLSQWIEYASRLERAPSPADFATMLDADPQQIRDAPALRASSYWELIAALMAKVARAVAAAHEANVIHRDIKPANILVDRRGNPKLADFGLARIGPHSTLTQSGEQLGTLLYLSPEVKNTDARASEPGSDVYGLGITLYHLITRRPPFLGDYFAVAAQIGVVDPKRPREIDSAIPADLEAICCRAIQIRSEDRHLTAADFAKHLEAFIERRPIPSLMPSRWLTGWRHIQRSPGPTIAWAVSSILAVVLVVWVYERIGEARDGELRELVSGFSPVLTFHPPRPDGSSAPLPAGLGAELSRATDLSPNPVLDVYMMIHATQSGELELAQRALGDLERSDVLSTEVITALDTWVRAPDHVRPLVPALLSPTPREDELNHLTAIDRFLRAWSAFRSGEEETALEELVIAVDMSPDDWMIRDFRAFVATAVGETKLAVHDATFVEGIVGPTARTQWVLGISAYRAGEWAQAIKRFEVSDALCPQQQVTLNNLAEQHRLLAARGGVDASAHHASEAERYYLEAIDAREDIVKSYLNYARFLRDEGQHARAIQALASVRGASVQDQARLQAGQSRVYKQWAAAEPERADQYLREAYRLLAEVADRTGQVEDQHDLLVLASHVGALDYGQIMAGLEGTLSTIVEQRSLPTLAEALADLADVAHRNDDPERARLYGPMSAAFAALRPTVTEPKNSGEPPAEKMTSAKQSPEAEPDS